MPEAITWLSDEDRRLLVAHYRFYHALDTGASAASTPAQQRFVAVCRGTAAPVSAHERAYANLKAFLHASGATESDMVSSQFSLAASCAPGEHADPPLPAERRWTEELLSQLTPRRRAILKLRLGCLPLSDLELRKVLADKRAEAVEVKPRSLRDVAALIGVSKERIRQIESRSLEKLGLKSGK
jgi:hypothetical protein